MASGSFHSSGGSRAANWGLGATPFLKEFLFTAARNSPSPAHRFECSQHHQVERALQNVAFPCRHPKDEYRVSFSMSTGEHPCARPAHPYRQMEAIRRKRGGARVDISTLPRHEKYLICVGSGSRDIFLPASACVQPPTGGDATSLLDSANSLGRTSS